LFKRIKMAEIVLEAKIREKNGKEISKKLRRMGSVPAILYGGGEDPLPLEIELRLLHTLFKGRPKESSIVALRLPKEKKGRKVLIREVQYDPVKGSILHLDLQRLLMEEKVTVSVPIHLTGESIGVKADGGIMEHILREIEIRCLPAEIPDHFEVDVSSLKIGNSIHVSDLPQVNIEILTDPGSPIVTILPPTVVAEVTPPVEEVVIEPELVEKKKKEEAEPEETKE